MMLEHLGEDDAANTIVAAIETVLADPAALTPDLGGKANTKDLGRAICDAISG